MLSDNAEKPGTVKLTLARPTAHIDNEPLSVSQSAQQDHRSFNHGRMTRKKNKPRKSDAFSTAALSKVTGSVLLPP